MCRQVITDCLKRSKKDEVPWTSLKYLIGEIIYGGKVIDSYDRRILLTYVEEYFGDFIHSCYQPFSYYNCKARSKPLEYMEMEKNILERNKQSTNLRGKFFLECINLHIHFRLLYSFHLSDI